MDNVVNLHKWVEAKGKSMYDVASNLLNPYGYMKSLAKEIIEDPRFKNLDERTKNGVGTIDEFIGEIDEARCRACIRYMENVLKRF